MHLPFRPSALAIMADVDKVCSNVNLDEPWPFNDGVDPQDIARPHPSLHTSDASRSSSSSLGSGDGGSNAEVSSSSVDNASAVCEGSPAPFTIYEDPPSDTETAPPLNYIQQAIEDFRDPAGDAEWSLPAGPYLLVRDNHKGDRLYTTLGLSQLAELANRRSFARIASDDDYVASWVSDWEPPEVLARVRDVFQHPRSYGARRVFAAAAAFKFLGLWVRCAPPADDFPAAHEFWAAHFALLQRELLEPPPPPAADEAAARDAGLAVLRGADRQFYRRWGRRPAGVEYVLLAAETEAAQRRPLLASHARFHRGQLAARAARDPPAATHAAFWAARAAFLDAWAARRDRQRLGDAAGRAPRWLRTGEGPLPGGRACTPQDRADRARWCAIWGGADGRAALAAAVGAVLEERAIAHRECGRPLSVIRTGENVAGGRGVPWWQAYWDPEETENRKPEESEEESEEAWDPEAYA